GAIIGTIAYMSPEQAAGKPLDTRSDIFAFGVVLYEMLSDEKPFEGATELETLQMIIHAKAKRLSNAFPSRVIAAVEKCLEKDPAGRYQSMRELVIELRRVSRDSEITPALPGNTHAAKAAQVAERTPSPERESGSSIPSMAVLPFVNEGGNPEMEYLGDGLTESIIFSLSQLAELHVMARSTVFRYKGCSDEAQHIGKDLGVRAVLTGRVLQRGETLLISAELVDVEKGWQLWGEQYRRKTQDIFAIEEDIAREISEKLRLKLTPEKQNRLAKRYTENVAAYHLYLKGRFYWGKRTAEGLHRAIEYFREAIEGDPTYALAYAGLAEGYIPLGFYCHVAPNDAFPKARSAAEKALE